MFKKSVSYLILSSLLLADAASCMDPQEGDRPLSPRSPRRNLEVPNEGVEIPSHASSSNDPLILEDDSMLQQVEEGISAIIDPQERLQAIHMLPFDEQSRSLVQKLLVELVLQDMTPKVLRREILPMIYLTDSLDEVTRERLTNLKATFVSDEELPLKERFSLLPPFGEESPPVAVLLNLAQALEAESEEFSSDLDICRLMIFIKFLMTYSCTESQQGLEICFFKQPALFLEVVSGKEWLVTTLEISEESKRTSMLQRLREVFHSTEDVKKMMTAAKFILQYSQNLEDKDATLEIFFNSFQSIANATKASQDSLLKEKSDISEACALLIPFVPEDKVHLWKALSDDMLQQVRAGISEIIDPQERLEAINSLNELIRYPLLAGLALQEDMPKNVRQRALLSITSTDSLDDVTREQLKNLRSIFLNDETLSFQERYKFWPFQEEDPSKSTLLSLMHAFEVTLDPENEEFVDSMLYPFLYCLSENSDPEIQQGLEGIYFKHPIIFAGYLKEWLDAFLERSEENQKTLILRRMQEAMQIAEKAGSVTRAAKFLFQHSQNLAIQGAATQALWKLVEKQNSITSELSNEEGEEEWGKDDVVQACKLLLKYAPLTEATKQASFIKRERLKESLQHWQETLKQVKASRGKKRNKSRKIQHAHNNITELQTELRTLDKLQKRQSFYGQSHTFSAREPILNFLFAEAESEFYPNAILVLLTQNDSSVRLKAQQLGEQRVDSTNLEYVLNLFDDLQKKNIEKDLRHKIQEKLKPVFNLVTDKNILCYIAHIFLSSDDENLALKSFNYLKEALVEFDYDYSEYIVDEIIRAVGVDHPWAQNVINIRVGMEQSDHPKSAFGVHRKLLEKVKEPVEHHPSSSRLDDERVVTFNIETLQAPRSQRDVLPIQHSEFMDLANCLREEVRRNSGARAHFFTISEKYSVEDLVNKAGETYFKSLLDSDKGPGAVNLISFKLRQLITDIRALKIQALEAQSPPESGLSPASKAMAQLLVNVMECDTNKDDGIDHTLRLLRNESIVSEEVMQEERLIATARDHIMEDLRQRRESLLAGEGPVVKHLLFGDEENQDRKKYDPPHQGKYLGSLLEGVIGTFLEGKFVAFDSNGGLVEEKLRSYTRQQALDTLYLYFKPENEIQHYLEKFNKEGGKGRPARLINALMKNDMMKDTPEGKKEVNEKYSIFDSETWEFKGYTPLLVAEILLRLNILTVVEETLPTEPSSSASGSKVTETSAIRASVGEALLAQQPECSCCPDGVHVRPSS